jgi:hypothetical protein
MRLLDRARRLRLPVADSGVARVQGRCAACAHFRNDAAYLESVLGGLASLSSAHGSVRADDGICLRHDRYLSARAQCADFTARAGAP